MNSLCKSTFVILLNSGKPLTSISSWIKRTYFHTGNEEISQEHYDHDVPMLRGAKKWWYFWPLFLDLMKTTNRNLSVLYPCPATDISSCGFDSTVSLLSGKCSHKTQTPMQKAHPDCGSFPRFLKALPAWAKDETENQARSNCVFLERVGRK